MQRHCSIDSLPKLSVGFLVPACNISSRDQVTEIQLLWPRRKRSTVPSWIPLWNRHLFLERNIWMVYLYGNLPPLPEAGLQWWLAVQNKVQKIAGWMAASPCFSALQGHVLGNCEARSQFSTSALCAALSVHTQSLNAGLHLVWRAVIKWGFGCPRLPDNRSFPILMSCPRGSVLFVTPDLTAPMHLIWGNLGNCTSSCGTWCSAL